MNFLIGRVKVAWTSDRDEHDDKDDDDVGAGESLDALVEMLFSWLLAFLLCLFLLF